MYYKYISDLNSSRIIKVTPKYILCHIRQYVYKYVMMTILSGSGGSWDRHSVCL